MHKYTVIFEKNGASASLAPNEIADDDELAVELNATDKLTLMLYPQFSAWGFPQKAITYVTLLNLQTKQVEFYGRVADIEDSMDSSGRFCRRMVCAGVLDFLGDTIADAATYSKTTTADAIVQALLDGHNPKVDTKRQIQKGNVSNVLPKNDITLDYCTTFEALQTAIVGNMGLEMRIRRAGGAYYLDVAQSFGSQSSTVIKIGDNLQDIRATYSASDKLVTRLIPLGGVGYDSKRLTIKNAADNTSGNIYIDNAEMVSTYGVHEGTLILNEIIAQTKYKEAEAAQLLYEIGVEEAALLGDTDVTITLSAIDLQKIGYANYSGFELGNTHTVLCPKLGLYKAFRITGLTRKLSSAKNTQLTISTGTARTYSISTSLAKRIADLNVTITRNYSTSSSNYTRIVSEHFDGVNKIQTINKVDFNALQQKLEDTLYLVKDEEEDTIEAYLGDEEVKSEGGGGGETEYIGTISHAALVGGGGGWTPATDPVSVFYQAGVPAYYGGAPARMIVQGNRVLFNVPYNEITTADISSDVYWVATSGRTRHRSVFVYEQTASTVTIQTGDNTSYLRYTYNVNPGEIAEFVFGIVLDFQTISTTSSSTSGQVGSVSDYVTITPSGSTTQYAAQLAAFLGGTILMPSKITRNSDSTSYIGSMPIFSKDELHFDLGLAKRYEVEAT